MFHLVIGNSFLALFAIDAGLSVLDGLLRLSGFEGLPFLRNAVAIAVALTLVPVYLLVAASPRLPAAVFLPPLFVGAWLSLGAVPLQLWFDDLASLDLAASLIQLAAAGLAYATVYLRSGRRTAAFDSSAARGPTFAPLRFAGLAGGAVVLGPPLLAAYLVLALTTLIESSTGGFVQVDRHGIYLVENHYRKADREIRLVGMMHIGNAEVYEQIFDSFELPETVVLEEGVTDDSHLLESTLSYGKLADSLQLVVQQRVSSHFEERSSEWPRILHRDMDVSEFSDETLEFVHKVAVVANALDDPEAMLEKLQEDPSWLPARSDTVLHDILTRRNERLLGEIEDALLDYERVIVPWGALHMPWLEHEIEQRGFARTHSERRLFIGWEGIVNALKEQSDNPMVGPPGFEPETIRL